MNSKEGSLGTSEPLHSVAGITAAASEVLALVVSIGFDLTTDQQVAIIGVVAVLAPLLVGIVARGKVFSPDAVARIEHASVDEVLLPEHDPAGGVETYDEIESASGGTLATGGEPTGDEEDKPHDDLDELPAANANT